MSQNKTKLAPRSFLFIPADRVDFAAKAAATSADAVCFDLEDAITMNAKSSAREHLPRSIAAVRQSDIRIYVRVNSELELIADDLEIALKAQVDGIVLPKARSLEHISLVSEAIARLENKPDSTTLIAMVENVAGLHKLHHTSLKTPKCLSGLLFGPEDYCADMGVQINSDLLDKAFISMVECARLLGIQAFGFPGSIAEFGDLDAFTNTLIRGRNFGAAGAFCIHPTQVQVANHTFSPTPDEIAWAQQAVAAYANVKDSGVIALNKQMIDRPVIERARQILDRAKSLQNSN